MNVFTGICAISRPIAVKWHCCRLYISLSLIGNNVMWIQCNSSIFQSLKQFEWKLHLYSNKYVPNIWYLPYFIWFNVEITMKTSYQKYRNSNWIEYLRNWNPLRTKKFRVFGWPNPTRLLDGEKITYKSFIQRKITE